MKCNEVKGLLSEYLDEQLSTSTAESVRSHLGECAKCAQLCQEIHQTIHIVKGLPYESAPSDFSSKLSQRLAEKTTQETWLHRLFSAIFTSNLRPAYITTILLFLTIFISSWIHSPQTNAPAPENAYLQAVIDDHSVYAAHQPLTDGSSEIFRSGLDSVSYE